MQSRKMSIRLNQAEREVLEMLYLERRMAIDPYESRPRELSDLTDSFNSLTGRSDPPEDILHYMRTRRKKSDWPKVGRSALRLRDDLDGIVTPEELLVLEGIYTRIGRVHGKGNDSFAHEPELREELEHEFVRAVGRYISGGQLLAVLRDRRKSGHLERLGIPPLADREGFADLDEAAGK
ncbi:hypothetical protein LCGC14_1846900 [marine sediment metagenome]|uniref:Uncharacterized protein n=1 Tax=marine sediment metagenome TaxID=412755 RepID=A0A0F9JAS1_9ZZZZ